MKVGIPKGLLYCKYSPFLQTFFDQLGVTVVTSLDTNQEIINEGIKHCVDEACLPIKVFHGHVASIKNQCDIILIPRLMQIREREYICPKFCGLPEMVLNSIPDMPKSIVTPIYATSKEKLYCWAKEVGGNFTKDKRKIKRAFESAILEQENAKGGIKNENYKINVALIGHPYNIYDSYINMNVVKKLNKLGVGVITEEYIEDSFIDREIKQLYKRPFWTFARSSYGFATYVATQKNVKGIVYLSSFACGIDSVVIDLIKGKIGDFPFMLLKIDEHTGEAGLDTRVEAFVDMLERSC